MAKVQLNVDPHQTPEEEAQLVARVAAAVTEETGEREVSFELNETDKVDLRHGVAQRMGRGARWGG